MKIFVECVPCFLRQALEASKMATRDDWVQARILRRVLCEAAEFSFQLSPPHMGQIIHRIVRQESGIDDPYRQEKSRLNRLAADLYETLKLEVARSQKPRDMALRLAIAGNILDFGPPDNGSEMKLGPIVESAISQDLDIDYRGEFWRAMEDAESILYLADNAGEIYFDRILLEYLPTEKITLAVRGGPAINDLTMEDLNGTDLKVLIPVIDNGSDAPGTILEDCSENFRQRFEAADVIISKGQGNYETLNTVNKHIFYLLKAKCSVIARDLDCRPGGLIVKEAPVKPD
ncbi:DUF89 domain-containing protein [Candidatus Zixiibacteriota bacterium]